MLQVLPEMAQGTGSLGSGPWLLGAGVVLVLAAIVVILFIKRIIVNSALGLGIWGVVVFGLQVDLPLIPSFAVSVIFGLAGIGALLVLKFFNWI